MSQKRLYNFHFNMFDNPELWDETNYRKDHSFSFNKLLAPFRTIYHNKLLILGFILFGSGLSALIWSFLTLLSLAN